MMRRVAINYNFNDRDWYGGRNYFGSLLQAVAVCMPHEFTFVLILGHDTETSLPAQFPTLEVVRTRLMDRLSPPWLLRQCDLRWFDRDRLMASFLRRRGIDIVSHSMPLGRDHGLKTMPWLYDFQFLHLPELWNPRHRRWATQWYTAASRDSDAVLVSSESALADLKSLSGERGATPHVLRFVSNPVDFARLPSAKELRERYDLPERFLYLPNQFWENKNHGLAIDALATLRSQGGEATIVCTGKTEDGRQPDYFDRLMARCHARGVADHFRVLGIVPYTDSQALMRDARAVINPSRFEGWSTTVEEAKTLQKDLLLSDISVHREQAPQRGRFFAVDDADALADLMAETLQSPTPPVAEAEVRADHARRLREFGDSYLRILRTL